MLHAPGGAYVVSRAGSELLALPLGDVVEVMRPLPISRLEGAPAFVIGAAFVRGAPVPVVDARLLLGRERPGPAGRWLAVRLGARRAVLAVDAVIGARTFRASDLGDLPPLLQGVAAGAAESVAALDGGLALVLQAGKLLPEPFWAALEGARG